MKKMIVLLCVLAMIVGAMGVFASATAIVAKIGNESYKTMEAAIADADNGVIVLNTSLEGLVIPAGKVVNLDLNGCSVEGVSVDATSELYIQDSATDDFDASDCGFVTGEVTGPVYGQEIDEQTRYVMLDNGDELSFHCLQMGIDTAILSPDTAGISYSTVFRSTEMVAEQVTSFGVAVSVVGEPVLENGALSEHSKCTDLKNFVGGTTGNTGRSSKVTGILKEGNAYLTNVANAETDIYGKPYVKLGDTYLLGALAKYNLKQVAEAANEDGVWEIQTPAAQKAMGEMYTAFTSVMKNWSVSKVVAYAEAAAKNAEDRTLKILTLGHSLALDSGHLLALIADAQGLPEEYDELVVGTLYYSGCELWRHVQYLTNDSPEYALYISSTKTADQIPVITKNVTMEYALTYDYWDIVIMQGGVFEIAVDTTYTNGNIQTIQNYVRKNTHNPDVKFAWHMQWAPPTDDDLRATYSSSPNWYVTQYEKYNDDRLTLYNAITGCVEKNILPDDTFEFIIPSGTALQNAWSSSFTEKQLHRDYVHASEYGRAISSYTWYCRLFGIDQLDEIKLDEIPKQFFHEKRPVRTEPELTQLEKDVLLESVNNALKTPFAMTQSQYVSAS